MSVHPAVSVLVVAQPSSVFPEGLMNYHVCVYIYICCVFVGLANKGSLYWFILYCYTTIHGAKNNVEMLVTAA